MLAFFFFYGREKSLSGGSMLGATMHPQTPQYIIYLVPLIMSQVFGINADSILNCLGMLIASGMLKGFS